MIAVMKCPSVLMWNYWQPKDDLLWCILLGFQRLFPNEREYRATLHDNACSWHCGVPFYFRCILHKRVHDLSVCLGSLDVMKMNWGQCPAGWKGQSQGKEGYPTIGLEAVSDYNLWIWHSTFGYAGSHNDINIWINLHCMIQC